MIFAILSIPIILWGVKYIMDGMKPKPNLAVFSTTDIVKEIISEHGEITGQLPTAILVKEDGFDVNKIKEYDGQDIKKFEFRPQNFKQFIGQAEAKNRAKTIIKKVNRGLKSHFLVDGIRGHGKTTFVELIAKNLDAHLIERVGKHLDEKNLVDVINEINTSKNKNVVFFIDELDSMDWKAIKVLNPIIESFKISGKKIKPFIFVGATINKHILIKNNPDTLDRIPTHIKFERYNAEEIGQILTQYKQQLYSQDSVPQEVIKIISENCKFNPRTSLALLDEYIVEKNIEEVLKNAGIVFAGLTKKDIQLLTVLSTAKRAMGANALAMKVGLSQKEYEQEFEPFLVEYDYINRVPSRIITDKGLELLRRIKCTN